MYSYQQNGGWIGAAVEASLPEAAASQCYEFEQSVAFLVLTALAAVAVLGYACALTLSRRRLTGMDVLSALLVGAGVIRWASKELRSGTHPKSGLSSCHEIAKIPEFIFNNIPYSRHQYIYNLMSSVIP